ncbi:MAG: hypothetical protein IK005_01735 [Paludibacteraceae bacterium]|nr:hypothetical protein [Paludibacteraceae bacterium]MBR4839178.1 hypothetical protein [Paludibacteraceae bacterium]
MFGWTKKALGNVKEFSDLTGSSARNVIAGNFFKKEFFLRQGWLFLMILAMLFCYVGNRYVCQQKIMEIDRLQKELLDVKLDALTRTSDLMLISRQSQVKKIIKNHGVDLTESTTPPFRIE